MTPASGTTTGSEQVRFRSTWAQWGWLVGSVTVVLLLALAVTALTTETPSASSFGPMNFVLVFLVTYAVLTALVYRWQGVTLTHEALVVHNLNHRVIPWSDIQTIAVEPLLWTMTVVVREGSGRRTRLRAPVTGFLAWDSRFSVKFQTIGEWFMARRGDGTASPPGART